MCGLHDPCAAARPQPPAPLRLISQAAAPPCLPETVRQPRSPAPLRRSGLQYGRNVDLARYSRARGRTTHNGAGAASAADVWRQFAAGCSVRVLHPQRWVPQVHALLASLEGYFSCAAGCNTYLTPGGTQARTCNNPHLDSTHAPRTRPLPPSEVPEATRRGCPQNAPRRRRRRPLPQGFAPHFDDIDAFVLQLEGRKRWRRAPSPLHPRAAAAPPRR